MNPPCLAPPKSYHRGRIWRNPLFVTAVLAGVAVLWLRPFRARVRGDSMLPTLADGDVVVAARGLRPRRGDLAIVRHDGVEMVKRIDAAPSDEAMPGWTLESDEWLVTGDNRAQSTDSRSFGTLRDADVVARVLWPPSSPA